MEQLVASKYVSDLRELIFLKKHNVVRELARQQVVKERIQSIINECDPIISKIKEYDNKAQLSEQEAKEKDELKEKLVERWRVKLWYQNELKESEKDLVQFQTELDDLQGQLVHIELCHPDVAK